MLRGLLNGFINSRASVWRAAVVFLIGVLILVFLLYIDRHNRISHIIQSWGIVGIIIAIFLMMVLCMTPIPSEGLLIMYLKVYGVGFGIAYSWLGSTLSTLVIYLIARYFGRPMLRNVVSDDRFRQVNEWVTHKGSIGLLVARLLPIPAFVVNYAAGLIPSVRFWSYLWTGVVAILPYYTGAALVYLGVFTNWIWICVGIIPLALVGVIGFLLGRRKEISSEANRYS